MMTYASFKMEHADRWGASVSTYYRVIQFDIHGTVAWLEKGGYKVPIPVSHLDFKELPGG